MYVKSIGFFLFGVFLLLVALKDINFNEFISAVKNLPMKWIFLSMLLGYMAFVFRGLRWFLLIKPLGYNPKISNLIHSIAFGYLFNSFIPRSGEIMRCTALNKVSSIPVSTLFGHVLLERFIDLIILCSLLIMSVVINYNHFMIFFEGFSISINVFIYFGLFLVLLYFFYKTAIIFLTQAQKNKLNKFLNGIKLGLTSIQEIQNKLLFTTYTILIWLCYLLMTIVCFYCFYETSNLSLSQGLFIMIAGGLGMVVPTPTGMGSYHYLVIKALTALSVSKEIAQFFAIIVHTSQAIMIIFTGFIAMMFLYNRKNHG